MIGDLRFLSGGGKRRIEDARQFHRFLKKWFKSLGREKSLAHSEFYPTGTLICLLKANVDLVGEVSARLAPNGSPIVSGHRSAASRQLISNGTACHTSRQSFDKRQDSHSELHCSFDQFFPGHNPPIKS